MTSPGSPTPPGWPPDQPAGQPQGPGWGQAPGPPGWGQAPVGWGQAPVGGWDVPPPAPKPGVIPLRALGVGDVLEATIATMRRYPAATFGSSLALVAVAAVLQSALLWPVVQAFADLPSEPPVDPAGLEQWTTALESFPWQWALVAGVLAGMVSFALLTSLTGLLAVVVGQAVLGRDLSFGQAWRRAAPRLPRLLVTVLLVGLAVTAVWLVLVLLWLLAVAGAVPGVVLLALGLLSVAAVPVTVFLGVRLALAAPAVMLESDGGRPIGPVRAVSRSWALVRGGWWRTFGIVVLGGVIAGALNAVLSWPLQAVAGALPMQLGVALLLGLVGVVLGQAVSLPVSGLVLALVYVDRRIRTEALDVALARAAGADAGAARPL